MLTKEELSYCMSLSVRELNRLRRAGFLTKEEWLQITIALQEQAQVAFPVFIEESAKDCPLMLIVSFCFGDGKAIRDAAKWVADTAESQGYILRMGAETLAQIFLANQALCKDIYIKVSKS